MVTMPDVFTLTCGSAQVLVPSTLVQLANKSMSDEVYYSPNCNYLGGFNYLGAVEKCNETLTWGAIIIWGGWTFDLK